MKLLKLCTVAIIILSSFLASCEEWSFCINGEGTVITETIAIDDFSIINLAGADNIVITHGTDLEVTATGHPNIIDKLETDVNGNEWVISLKNGCYRDYELTIYITMPDIEAITISGSGDVLVNDFINQGDLDLYISGSGKINLKTVEGCPNLIVGISGSGNVIAEEEFPALETLDITISGSGTFDGYPAITDKAYISIPGSGSCYVYAIDLLDIKISGSGNVMYKGNPEVTTHITGSGNITNTN